MESPATSEPESTLDRPLTPEDIQCRQYVAILDELQELPSFLWNKCDSSLPPQELIRLRIKPSHAGTPLKVKALCLPFVLNQPLAGSCQHIDLRKTQLVLRTEEFAKSVVKGNRKER